MKQILSIVLVLLGASLAGADVTPPPFYSDYVNCTDSNGHTVELYAVPGATAVRRAFLVINSTAFQGNADLTLHNFTSDSGNVTAVINFSSTGYPISAEVNQPPYYQATLPCTSDMYGGGSVSVHN